MSDFKQRLWSELVGEHAFALAYPVAARDRLADLPILEPPTLLAGPRPRWGASVRARLAASVAALAAVLAAATIAITSGTAPSAAYAVTRGSDGTVHISIAELTGVSGANAELEKLGVAVRVVPVVAGCKASGEIVVPPPPPSLGTEIAHAEAGIAVRPDLIPAGETVVLAAKQTGAAVSLTYAFYRGAAPACVATG